VKLAIFSDVHGNALALDAVLNDLAHEDLDGMICLGDAVQGGPQPSEVVRRLRGLGCPVVMGNADDWLLTGADSGKEEISAERRSRMDAVREWSLSRLSEADRQFIAGFPPTVEVALEGGRSLLGYHGSPASFDDFILPDTPEDEFQRMLAPHAAKILCGGHMHVQYIRHLGRSFHFNPGSVGVAYRHGQTEEGFQLDPWAEYALLTSRGDRLALEFRRIPFDVVELVQIARASGRPFADDFARPYGL
jgi:predicted phosphodiesterase